MVIFYFVYLMMLLETVPSAREVHRTLTRSLTALLPAPGLTAPDLRSVLLLLFDIIRSVWSLLLVNR